MTAEEMERVFEEYVAAANRHNGTAQMSKMREDCFFENIPLGLRVEGQAAVSATYGSALTTFPDYRREIEGQAFGEDTVVAWWLLCGTVRGELFGLAPTGRAIRVPVVSIVTFRDGLIQGERILFDLATLCHQAGVPLADALSAARRVPA